MRKFQRIATAFVLLLLVVTTIYAQDGGVWQELSEMNVPRSEMSAGVVDGKIYVPGGFGGLDVLEAYDPESDEWKILSPLPGERHHMMVTSDDEKLYVVGGALLDGAWTPQRALWAYDPESDEWSELMRMLEIRRAGAAVWLDGYLYVIGGEGGSDTLLRYDPEINIWKAFTKLNESREHVAAAVVDGKIYAIGGRWGREDLKSVEVYDPETNEWTYVADLNEARAGFGAATWDGKIIVAGGEQIGTFGAPVLNSVEMYDPEQDEWTLLTPMPFGVHGNPIAVVDDTLYVLGGSDQGGGIENYGRTMALKLTPDS